MFVTCVFGADRTVEIFRKWAELQIPMRMYVQEPAVLELLRNEGGTIELEPMVELAVSGTLPEHRNREKDTERHLQNMLLKIPCLGHCVRETSAEYYAYIDFDVFSLFRDPRTLSYLKHFRSELFASPGLYIPGAWGKGPVSKNAVCWRFCGAFLFGSRAALLDFETVYLTHLDYFDDGLTWEVNYWAWLEDKVDITWYQADHNDTLVRVPGVFGYHNLRATVTEYDYAGRSPYRPMSASFVRHNDRAILNTRYVNYWITNGAYWFPDNDPVIRTKNVCSLLVDRHPTCFVDVAEPDVVSRSGFSEGVEDIRLFVSVDGSLKFIGSTLQYSYTDKIRMMVGDYVVNEKVTLENVQVIMPPTDTWCEKNWSPIPLGDEDGFIYRWHPLEIGKIVDGKLEIVHRVPTNTEIFAKIKGSTPFYAYGDDWIGLVHFCEETTPRQYFHRLVVLNTDIVKVSESFCFLAPGVEFCIGMERSDTKYIFWISRQDRDPAMIEVDAGYWEDKWLSF